jgi:8-oxo-dGTP diphosphatase
MITKAAFLLFRENNGEKELLFARAKGKPYFVFPGGKQEAEETIEEALQRELQEELRAQAIGVKKIGVVLGYTPDGREMEMHLYSGQLEGTPQADSEIEEIAWMTQEDVEERKDRMTPMTLEHVLPFLKAEGIWS